MEKILQTADKMGENFTAKKSLGQNFLHAPHVVGKIIHETRIEAGINVLEVGPGKGVLTAGLLKAGAHVVAVEKDDRAIAFLEQMFAREIQEGKLEIIHGDILDFDPKNFAAKNSFKGRLHCGEYVIAANIPYYITGEFLRKFLESSCQPQRMMLMLQKEVAKRIAVNPGGDIAKNKGKNEKESILSMSVKAYGDPKYIITVPARYFRPVPNVDSALLLIDNISKDFFNDENHNNIDREKLEKFTETDFFAVVKTGFAHKRKVLIKNLEDFTSKSSHSQENGTKREILEKIWQKNDFSPKIRAEELTLDEWKTIAAELSSASL